MRNVQPRGRHLMDSRLKLIPPEMLQMMGLYMKPCRFCGAEAHICDNVFKGAGGKHYYAQCMECGNLTDEHADPRDAIKQWNEGAMIDESI